jgi:hypothetical protein
VPAGESDMLLKEKLPGRGGEESVALLACESSESERLRLSIGIVVRVEAEVWR